MRAWLSHNLHSLGIALERMRSAPLATLFTVLVIGIALSLPAGLYLALGNFKQVAGTLHSQTEISIFLKADVDAAQGRALAGRLQARPDIETARFVDRAEGLQHLRAAGLGDITAALPANPLPHVLLLAPGEASPDGLRALSEHLTGLPEVEGVKLDADWARRLAALTRLGEDLVALLAALLGLALAAITGNTIRLQIYAQRDEIEVARLIGATDRFIRRPFLYFGALQGLAGGIAAWGLIALSLAMLQGSVSLLATSYGTTYAIAALAWHEAAALLGASTLLGLVGAYFAVGHTLRGLDTA